MPVSWLALPPEPWKNGAGQTRTLAADSAARWRVSIADIDRDGPYSRFPGYDRVSVVLSGQGVELRGESAAMLLLPGEPAGFAGDAAFTSRLLGGPVRVLNLFVLRGAATAHVFVAGGAAAPLAAGGLDGSPRTTRLVLALRAGRLDGKAPGAALAAGEYLVTAAEGDAGGAFLPAARPPPGGISAIVLDIGVAAADGA
ncbi:Protein Ves [compost metagenome]|uniref:Protein Ves n=1 Tax=Achromobacter agilis TaxID=1353888 RepID=A0A446CE76_9BURK|nr:HutD family protein [Achromobacter agilis]SSW66167.1 Protein Ves [Achromobacter agilis]